MKINECSTLEDVYNLLEENLIPVYEFVEELINGKLWVLKRHFKQSFLNNNIYFNELTHTYAFHIIDEDDYNYGYGDVYFNFPNMGYYSTYSELLDGVSYKLYKVWILDSKPKVSTIKRN
jgi:hypothetical protein